MSDGKLSDSQIFQIPILANWNLPQIALLSEHPCEMFNEKKTKKFGLGHSSQAHALVEPEFVKRRRFLSSRLMIFVETVEMFPINFSFVAPLLKLYY